MAAQAMAREPLFRDTEPLRFPLATEPGPGKLVVADLNGDSREDLAVLAAEVVVFITGAAAPVPDLARASYPVTSPGPLFLAGDLDGDALPDLLAGGPAVIHVLRSAGEGRFRSAPDAPVDASPRAGKLVDLDEDGFLDLITVNQTAAKAGSLSVLLSDAKGGFLPQAVRTLGEDVVADSFAAEDFGGDGFLDIALAIGGAEPGVRVLPGEGGAGFGEPIDTPLAASPRLISPGYVDSDDRPDLVVLGAGSGGASQILHLENIGADEFTARIVGEDDDAPVDPALELLSVEDFDEDAIVDIVTQVDLYGLPGLRVRSGAGTGEFPGTADRVLSRNVLDFALLDVTGEGVRDLAVVESEDLGIYLGLDPGRLALRGTKLLDASPRGVAAFDWSGDGLLDVAAHASGAFYLFRGDGQGDFEDVLRQEESGSLEHMAIADVAGRPRAALADTAGGYVAIRELASDGTIASARDILIRGTISGIAAADFGGDPGSELVVSDLASREAKMILYLAGDPRPTPIDAGAPQTAVDAGDVDGDGDQDIVFATGIGLRILLGDGAGAFPGTKDLPFLANARAVRVEQGASGAPKGIAAIAADGSSLVWIADPLGTAEPVDLPDAAELASVRALDIDGDSIADLLTTARRPASELRARLGLAGGGFGPPESYRVGLDPGAFAVGDLSGDGLIDAVTADAGSRSLTLLEGNEGQRAAPAEFRRGDADLDGSAAITDAIVVLNWLFQGGPEPGCRDAADTDDSGVIDLTDPVRLLDFLFRGGPEPPAPGPEACGEDPTADELETCVAGCS